MSQSKRIQPRSEEHTSELQSRRDLVCRLLLEKKKPQAQQGIEASHPRRIRLNVGDFRERFELEFQPVRERRIASRKRHDERIRQRILRQARYHLLHACDAIELRQRRVPGLFFFLMLPPPPRSTLFPYTTLFR